MQIESHLTQSRNTQLFKATKSKLKKPIKILSCQIIRKTLMYLKIQFKKTNKKNDSTKNTLYR